MSTAGGPRIHSNHDFEAIMHDAIAKPVPSHSLRQTAQGAKREKIRGLAGGEASSNDLVAIVMTAA